MLNGLLGDETRSSSSSYFEFPDRVAHVFWRFRDPEHPAYDAALAAKYGDAVEKSYETMDAIVGDAAKALSPNDVLIVLSDHGFATWRRSVNYNTWLVENGYLVLKGGRRSARASRRSSRAGSSGSPWTGRSRGPTRWGSATSTSTSQGREDGGIVAPGAEYEALRNELMERSSRR